MHPYILHLPDCSSPAEVEVWLGYVTRVLKWHICHACQTLVSRSPVIQ